MSKPRLLPLLLLALPGGFLGAACGSDDPVAPAALDGVDAGGPTTDAGTPEAATAKDAGREAEALPPPCPDGQWDFDGRPDTTCLTWSTCAPGTFVGAPGSPTRDRGCSPCANGTLTTSENESRCVAWTPCAPGTVVDKAGTATTSPTCAACPAGQTSVGENATRCLLAATSLASGPNHTCARLSDGTLRCWGSNAEGQLGDGSLLDRSTPAVTGLANVTSVSTGTSHTCARLDNGRVYCWGKNELGALGDGTTLPKSAPTLVPGLFATRAAAGAVSTCFLTVDGGSLCVGGNSSGQLGRGNYTSSTALVPSALPLGVPFQNLISGSRHVCAVSNADALYCWGENLEGQIGDGSTTTRPIPVPVTLANVDTAALGDAHSCARTTGGALSCWGANGAGQIGDGTRERRTAPVSVLANVTAFGAGTRATCAALADGTARCWGDNTYGQLGDGTVVGKDVPTPVVDLAGVTAIAPGAAHTCAIARGTVHCWGDNTYGQLGDGTKTAHLRPAVVTF